MKTQRHQINPITCREYGLICRINSSSYTPGIRQKTGYYKIILKDGITLTTTWVHRLIAEAFIPNPGNLPCVDHINGNPSDNRVENLRWVTVRENSHNQRIHRSGKLACISKTPYGKFRVRTRFEGKKISIGNFNTEQEASKALEAFRISIHG